MSNEEKKKDNVISIGHNQNTYSKEQYTKLVNSLHRAHLFAQQEMCRVRRLFDEAFTKYPFSNPHETKLKDFQVHEKRRAADTMARKFYGYTDNKIEAIEKKAKADGLKLEEPTVDKSFSTKKDEEDANE